MTMAPDRRNPPAIQAFNEYADLVRAHADEPDLWDRPDREQARRAAHARFLEFYEGAQ